MKRIFALFLILATLLSLSACREHKEGSSTSESTETTIDISESLNDSTESINKPEQATTNSSENIQDTNESTTDDGGAVTETNPSVSTNQPATNPSTTTSPTTPAPEKESVSNTIQFNDLSGTWYAEGHDDITIRVGFVGENEIAFNGMGFDFSTGKLSPNKVFESKRYTCINNKATIEEVQLIGKTKLIYTGNHTTMNFYKTPNYPEEQLLPHEALLESVNGYYWYLDGYNYTYLYPQKDRWDYTKWESQHLFITEDTFVAYENLDPDTYWQYNSSNPTTSTLSQQLPDKLHAILIEKFNMRVVSNKLYMTANGKQYTFTKYTQKKPIDVVLEVDSTDVVVNQGEWCKINVNVSPWWQSYKLDATAVGAFRGDDYGYATDKGRASFSYFALDTGKATVIIKEPQSGKQKAINVTVVPARVTSVSLNKTSVELSKGQSETLLASVNPSNASDKRINWSSGDPNIATVSSDGTVTAKKPGTTIITATTRDGSFTASCQVTVIQSPLAVDASVAISTQVSSSSIAQGVKVTVMPSGGSENYVQYHIKLYYEGVYVGEVAANEMFVTPFKNGTYTAEVYVKDSNGSEATHTTTVILSSY